METIKGPAKQKVILHNVSWETYERLMEERGESRGHGSPMTGESWR